MRVLFVCHRFPFPPKRGGKIRPFNVIKHLAERHDVTVASLVRSDAEAEEGQGLAKYCSKFLMERIGKPAAVARMIARLPTATPSSMGYFHSPALARRLSRMLATEHFDVIFVHCAFAAPYVAHLTRVAKILDFGDMDSQKWLTYAGVRRFPLALGYAVEGRKLRRREESLAAQFDLCTCTTRAEMETLAGYGVATPIGWFPNGVDAEYFAPTARAYDRDTIAFVGRMDYYPNQEAMITFCRTVWPLLRARREGIKLLIVGAAPSRTVRDLGRLPGVTVTGSVPDVRPYLHQAAVAVAPLNIARGTQNKVLEAMAMGVPTVCSTAAAGGIDADPGRHTVTASTPEEYAGSIHRLLENPSERRRLAEAGRARILSHHSWEQSMRTLDGLIDECLSRRP
jgi:sugar transferase (PEP-CTERM/EpsH1 system associated)